MATKNLRDGVLTLSDGDTPTPNTLELTLEEGDLNFTETTNKIVVKDRGRLDHVRDGDEEQLTVSFTLKYVELIKQSTASAPTPYEALKNIGAASTWVTTDTYCGGVYSLDLLFKVIAPCDTEQDELITLSDFYVTSIEFKEGDEYNTLSVEGESLLTTPTVTKVTKTP